LKKLLISYLSRLSTCLIKLLFRKIYGYTYRKRKKACEEASLAVLGSGSGKGRKDLAELFKQMAKAYAQPFQTAVHPVVDDSAREALKPAA
jgi:hypothetical protein